MANEEKQDPAEDPDDIFLKYEFVYCWVEPHEIVQPRTDFNFKFKLWINHRIDPVIFSINYKTLKEILNYAREERIFFAAQRLPSSMLCAHI